MKRISFFLVLAVLAGLIFYPFKNKERNSIYRKPLLSKIEYADQDEVSTINSSTSKKEFNDYQRSKIIEEYFDRSGLESQIDGLDRLVEEKLLFFLEQNFLNNEQIESIKERIRASIGADKLRKVFLEEFLTTLKDGDLKELQKILGSSFVNRFIQLEEDSEGIKSLDDESFNQQLETYPLVPSRREILRKLDLVTKSSQISTKILMSVYHNILNGLDRTILPEINISKSNLGLEQALFEQTHESMIETLHLIYKDVSEEDLEAYLRLKESYPLNRIPALYMSAIDKHLYQQ